MGGSSVAPQPRWGLNIAGSIPRVGAVRQPLGFAPKSLWDLRIEDLHLWVMTSLTGRLHSFTGAYDSVQDLRAPPGAPDGAACFPLGQDALMGVG